MSGRHTGVSDTTTLGTYRYVQLMTFRRNGTPVPSPVWIAPDGDDLLVVTVDDTGKTKRLAHTARVELRPCSRRGVVADGVEPVAAVAHVLSDPTVHARHSARLLAKYGLEYRVMMLVEKVLALRSSGRPAGRVIVRITAPA